MLKTHMFCERVRAGKGLVALCVTRVDSKCKKVIGRTDLGENM